VLIRRSAELLSATAVIFLLLYFLLATGDRLRDNSERVMPDLRGRRRLRVVTRRMQREVSRYLMAITTINVGVGVGTFLLALAIGLPNAVLWGAMAGSLHFVPYLGPMVTLGILTVISLVSLPMPAALLMPGGFGLLTILEGQFVTPTVLGRHLSLNPVFILAGLIFWGWLWGVVGALLAVPILASFKIICDNHPPLKWVGTILGR